MDKENEKVLQYHVRVLNCLQELFEEDSEHFIGIEELNKDNNMTYFMHALATTVPASVYSKFTGDDKIDYLGFNHIANRLCVQFRTNKDKR